MNKVILMGRLTRDPDIKYTQGSNPMAVAKFMLAVDRRFKRENEPKADFINCTAFGKIAEFIEKYCKQGTKLAVEGRWQTGNYTNRDGQKVYTNDCMVESCEFAECKKTSDSNGGNKQQTSNTSASNANSGDFMYIPDGIDETLPFN